MKAVEIGDYVSFKLLFDHNAEIEARNSDGSSVLLLAVDGGHVDIINKLLELKVDVNSRNINGETPLIRAIRNKNIEVSKLLINSGADITSRNKDDDLDSASQKTLDNGKEKYQNGY
jgi:ankyrin repeat protein